jgi:hypothetical protein
MKYKIIKLDRRYSGHAFYQYLIEPITTDTTEGPLQFIEIRNWCWATYGTGAELKWSYKGSLWAWDTEYKYQRIYLKSQAELTLFTLKFAS